LTYTFTPIGPSAGAGGVISGMSVGTSYTVIASNGSCSSVASASFSNLAMLVTQAVQTITTTAPTCVAEGTSTITNYDSLLTYTFAPTGPSVGAGGVISGMSVGTSYTVTAGNGSCTSVASASFTILEQLESPVSPSVTVVDNEICVGQTGAFQINGSPNNVLTYSINSGSQQTITLNSLGEALIEVNNSTTTIVIELLEIDNGSCSNSISTTATIDVVNCVIPKGVSPNNDGLNDTWDLSGFDVKQVQIFNRYGVEVYSKSNYTNEWGGRANNGNELPDGTYYYVVSLQSGEVKTGWVYINREN
jgi:gliding motility-associated-like protein